MVVPDYPLHLLPHTGEAYDFVGDLYAGLTTDYPTKRIVFMGDSAGGGLAMGFAQQLRNEKKRQPDQLIVFSPWFDVSMTDTRIGIIDKEDKLLSIKGLKSAGQKYSGDLDLKDYRVSPLYGSFSGLCRLSIFTGTNDILNADAQKCRQLMTRSANQFQLFRVSRRCFMTGW
ncbi:MAG: alpha/beta hydrolase [Bacillus subtilis]|nr:alpha/beta hydrolase [Bacillus subtilis]